MNAPDFDPFAARALLEAALREDAPWADATTPALVPAGHTGSALIQTREELVLAGLPLIAALLELLGGGVEMTPLGWDGEHVVPDSTVARLDGPLATILAIERVALNTLAWLSGIATRTARAVQAVSGTPTRIAVSRRTTPGLRSLEMYAARVGGAVPHRASLADGTLITALHAAALRTRGLSIGDGVHTVRASAPAGLRIEVEVRTREEAVAALIAGADLLHLRGMSIDDVREVVARCRGRALTHAAGPFAPDDLRELARAGVELISPDDLILGAPPVGFRMELVAGG